MSDTGQTRRSARNSTKRNFNEVPEESDKEEVQISKKAKGDKKGKAAAVSGRLGTDEDVDFAMEDEVDLAVDDDENAVLSDEDFEFDATEHKTTKQSRRLNKESVGNLKEVPDARVYSDRTLSFVAKAEKAFEAFHARGHRALPSGSNAIPPSINDFFNQPPKSGKPRWKVAQTSRQGRWAGTLMKAKLSAAGIMTCYLQDANDKLITFDFAPSSTSPAILGDILKLERIMERIAKIYNAWPGPPLDSQPFRRLMVQVATAAEFPSDGFRIMVPTWKKKKGFICNIPFYNTETDQVDLYERSSYTAVESQKVSIPDVPTTADLRYADSNKVHVVPKAQDGSFASMLPSKEEIAKHTYGSKNAVTGATVAESRDGLLITEKFERFLSWKLTGFMGTKKDIRNTASNFAGLYLSGRTLGGKKVIRGPGQKGLRAIKVAKSGIFTEVAASTSFVEAMGWTPSRMKLKSRDFRWIAPILEAAERKWRESYDSEATWMECAALVDIANEEIFAGNPPLGNCYCTDDMRNDATHICGGCGREKPCLELLKNSWGIPVCPDCTASADKSASAINQHVVETGLKTRLEQEAKMMGREFDDPIVQNVYKQSLAHVIAQMTGCEPHEWRDGYTGVKRAFGVGFGPLSPTIEAIHPFVCLMAPDNSLQTWIHAKGNLTEVASAINMAKKTHPLASVASIKENVVQSENASPQAKQALDKALLRDVAEQRIIGLRYAMTRKDRLNRSFSPEEYLVAKQEFLTGKLSQGAGFDLDKAIQQSYYMYPHNQHVRCAWNDEQNAGIIQVCDDLETKYKVKILRADDGAPWPIPLENIPAHWSWNGLYSLMSARYRRMTYTCNRYWPTEDTTNSLACEVFTQMYGVQTGRLLDLPMSAAIRSPLRFSVAHYRHKRQMRTTFPAEPKSLADRMPDQGNISIETEFENMLKLDHLEQHYQLLVTLIKEFNPPQEMFNPAAERPTGHADNLPKQFTLEDFETIQDLPLMSMPGVDEDKVFDLLNGGSDSTRDGPDSGLGPLQPDGSGALDGEPESAPVRGDWSPVALETLRSRCRNVLETAKELRINQHGEVLQLSHRILFNLVAPQMDDATKEALSGDIDALERYIQNALDQAGGDGDGDGIKIAGDKSVGHAGENLPQESDLRFNEFQVEATAYMSTEGIVVNQKPLKDFLEAINSGRASDADDFSEAEGKDFLARMAAAKTIRYNKGKKTVSKR